MSIFKRLYRTVTISLCLISSFPLSALTVDEIAQKLENRPPEDKLLDASRKPSEVLAFMGVESGMTVIDVIAASGWYTETLAHVVGPEGKVYSQNPEGILAGRERATDKALQARIADHGLTQVVKVDTELEVSNIPAASVDFAITNLNYHDVVAGFRGIWGENAGPQMMSTIFSMLKPGGVFAVIDHAGNPNADNAALHRIDKQIVIDHAKAAGFRVEESDLLANASDDRTKGVFDETLRGETDRFILKLTKPE